jgi:hypothetical protein
VVLKDFNDLPPSAQKKIPEGKRASMDGPVDKQSYIQWLSKQSKARQLEVLGPGKYKLWKEGKISLKDMIDQRNRPLTVAELKKLD